MSDLGIAPFWIPLLWSALHVVKVVSSLVGGDLSDRLGRRALIAAGWIIYAVVYASFALFESTPAVVAMFLFYGLYFGLTEGVEKAWIADIAPAAARGTAFGVYYAALGIGSLIASLLFGSLWTRVSPSAAFFTGAGFAPRSRPRCYTCCFPAATMPRILVTNDDGVRSDGMHALADALEPLGDVIVVAPQTEASAIGHALTLRRPLRMEQLEDARLRSRRHADRLRQHRHHPAVQPTAGCPTSIVSGINKGYNLGDDVTYSGTVAGALEGALLGIPCDRRVARALRAAITTSAPQPRAGAARRRDGPVARARAAHLPQHQRAAGPAEGHARDVPGQAQPHHRRDERDDPRGRPYYWIEEGQDEWEPHDRSDYQAVKDGYISVTPLQPDLTAHDEMTTLDGWLRD